MSSPSQQTSRYPEAVAILLWDVDVASVDLRAHRDYIIERVMARGGWEAMRWLRDTYANEELADVLQRRAHRLAPRERAYWALISGAEIDAARGGGQPPWAVHP